MDKAEVGASASGGDGTKMVLTFALYSPSMCLCQRFPSLIVFGRGAV